MKPLHFGLLIAGGTLAGGLAVKMTQFPAVPVTTSRPRTAPAAPAKPVPVIPAPPPAIKSSPFTDDNSKASQEATASAPPAIYTESPSPQASAAPKKAAAHAPMKVARSRPLEWAPVPYQPSRPGTASSGQADAPAHSESPEPKPQSATAAEQPETSGAPSGASAATSGVSSAVAPAEAAPVKEAEPQQAVARQVTLGTGLTIAVRLDETLSTDRNMAGDKFHASLAEPLIANGLVIAERGARATGRVVDVQKGGRFGGRSLLELELSSVTTSDGQEIAISTDPWAKQGGSSASADAGKIGGAAALGAIIGAIAGGGAGAAIGAGVGGAAGAGVALGSGPASTKTTAETVIHFRLAARVTITERRL